MKKQLNILVTNDDGYQASGIKALVNVASKLGPVTVVAPKSAQSGMSMAVTMGFRPIAVKHLGKDIFGKGENPVDWWYLDGTPASCVKFGLDNIFADVRPDLILSGVNHGANYATAALYSGTIGAVMEGALADVPSIGVSLDSFRPDADFSSIEEMLPGILEKLLPFAMERQRKDGSFYNINFPNISSAQIKGVRAAVMGRAHWENEYLHYDASMIRSSFGIEPSEEHMALLKNAREGETFYVMAGDFTDEMRNPSNADNRLVSEGYVAISVHNIMNCDASLVVELEKHLA